MQQTSQALGPPEAPAHIKLSCSLPHLQTHRTLGLLPDGKTPGSALPSSLLYAAGQTLPLAMPAQRPLSLLMGSAPPRACPYGSSAPGGCLEHGDRSTPCSCHLEHLFFLIEALKYSLGWKKDRQARKPKLLWLKLKRYHHFCTLCWHSAAQRQLCTTWGRENTEATAREALRH